MTQRHEDLQVWSLACHYVLDQSGRARLHDARAALNGLALGIESLRHDGSVTGGVDGGPTRILDRMHRDLRAAADELTAVQSLMAGVASGDVVRLPQVLEWAETVAAPVARRVGATLAVSTVAPVPRPRIDSHISLAVAVALIEGTVAAGRGGTCRATIDTDPLVLTVSRESPAAGDGDQEPWSIALRLLDRLLGPASRLVSGGSHDQLRIELRDSG